MRGEVGVRVEVEVGVGVDLEESPPPPAARGEREEPEAALVEVELDVDVGVEVGVVRGAPRRRGRLGGGRGAGRSRTTSSARLSSRSPWNDGCRIFPSPVHSVNATSQTSSGRTQCAFLPSQPAGRGVNGHSCAASGASLARSARAPAFVKPVPTLPAKRSAPPSKTPTSSAPRASRAAPSGSVKPPTTSSCRFTHFVFTQLAFRPGRYGWSARFETIPSRPSRHASRNTAAPLASTWGAYRTIPRTSRRRRARSALRSRSGREATSSPSRARRSNAK